jgi:hypothetical protein
MSLIFKEEGHKYENIDPESKIKWTGVTSFIHSFQEPFDKGAVAIKSSKNKNSKWYNINPEEIIKIWDEENKRAITLGSYYHNQRESDILSLDTLGVEGIDLPIIPPIIKEGVKYAPKQRLSNGIYPEHFVYLKSAGLCGQADRVEVIDGKVNIIDFKTNKEIKTKSYVNWEGISKKMLSPISHLDDCNFIHYSLQLSMYMYMILKHNPKLKPGKMILHHVVFEKEGETEFGYPIIKYNENGDPIVKEVIPYECNYLKDEVITLINYLKEKKQYDS